MRKSFLAAVAVCFVAATPAHAIVAGTDVPAGQYTNVAEIVIAQALGCTGTLIAPDYVMTAGHCASLTGEVIAQPIATFPAAAYDVRLGSNKSGQGTKYAVSDLVVEPQYLARQGYDVTLLHLATPVTGIAPTPIAGPSDRGIWQPGDVQTIVGWGTTSSGGDAPDTLQKANVPIVSDAACEAAYGSESLGLTGYSGFESTSQVCAGDGVHDTCQGDSGGPMFATGVSGALRLTGATSYGQGCADPDYPGVYARVADATLRTWVGSIVPAAVAP
ncbi:MAG: S1 family peptidase [Solirubrobacteraceae bacterium]